MNPLANSQAGRPEWDRLEAQITGPDEVYTWESSWTFGLIGDDGESDEGAEEAPEEDTEEKPEEQPEED